MKPCPSCGKELTGKPSFKWDLSREEYQEILGERFIWWMENCPHCKSTVVLRKEILTDSEASCKS